MISRLTILDLWRRVPWGFAWICQGVPSKLVTQVPRRPAITCACLVAGKPRGLETTFFLFGWNDFCLEILLRFCWHHKTTGSIYFFCHFHRLVFLFVGLHHGSCSRVPRRLYLGRCLCQTIPSHSVDNFYTELFPNSLTGCCQISMAVARFLSTYVFITTNPGKHNFFIEFQFGISCFCMAPGFHRTPGAIADSRNYYRNTHPVFPRCRSKLSVYIQSRYDATSSLSS